MSWHSYYKLSEEALKQWYNAVGVDSNEVNFKNIETSKISDLSYVSPFSMIHYLQNFSGYRALTEYIDIEYQRFVNKLCGFCGSTSSLYEKIQQATYEEAYLGILKTATNLNLIQKDSTDYLLNYDRLDTIIYTVMQIMNDVMDSEEIISFYNKIKNGQVSEILRTYKKYGYLSLLIYLAMHPDNDIPDYNMFENDKSSTISVKNLITLVSNNIYSKTDYDVEQKPFDLSMIGLQEVEVPGLPIKAMTKKHNKYDFSYLPEKYIKELLEHYHLPFERLSYLKTRKLVKEEADRRKKTPEE